MLALAIVAEYELPCLHSHPMTLPLSSRCFIGRETLSEDSLHLFQLQQIFDRAAEGGHDCHAQTLKARLPCVKKRKLSCHP